MSGEDNARLFRKVALERLSSPDRLDAMLGLNRPQWPLVWAALAMAAVTTAYWGLEGRLPQKVIGRCILTSPGGVAEITAVASGTVSDLSLKVGDRVRAGQQIARIVRSDLFEQIAQARARLAELERRQNEINSFARISSDQSRNDRAAQQSTIEAQSRLAADRASVLERRIVVERGLFAQGLITRQALLDTEQEHSAAILERERLLDRSKQLALQFDEDERQRSRERTSIQFQVNETRRNLEALLDIERQTAPVVTPYAGIVIEVKAHNGVSVGFGAALIQIERIDTEGATLEAAVYVPGGEGKLLASGMPVDIVPDNVKRQEFGFIRGRIALVSEYPASLPGMRMLVQNDNLLRELSGARSTIFARASLDRRADGGFSWSAAASTPPAVRSGTLCQAEITVAEKRPVDLVMPTLRRWIGIS